MKVKQLNSFELFFREFVKEFGGDVLDEAQDGHTADYLFRNHGIIAELKTLTADQTDNVNRKLSPRISEWIRINRQVPPGIIQGGKYFVVFKDMPKEIQDCWLGLLKVAVEPIIRDANRQIRDTKHRMNLLSAKGIILVANGSNLYCQRS